MVESVRRPPQTESPRVGRRGEGGEDGEVSLEALEFRIGFEMMLMLALRPKRGGLLSFALPNKKEIPPPSIVPY